MSLRRNFLNPTVFKEREIEQIPVTTTNKREKKYKAKVDRGLSPITSDEDKDVVQ